MLPRSSYSKVFLGCSCVDCPCFMQPCSSYSKVFRGCSCLGSRLLYAALFFILKGVLGLLLRGLPLLYSALFFIFKSVCGLLLRGLSLLYAALFFIFKGVLGLLLRGLPLLYAALFFIFKGVLGLLLRRLVLALCSPVLHIQRCFWRLQRGVGPAFMQPHQRLMMPLVTDVQCLSWQTGRHLAMSALPMSAGISQRIMLFLYLPWSGGHFKPGVSCYLLSFLLFRQFIFFNYELECVFAYSVCSFYLNKQ